MLDRALLIAMGRKKWTTPEGKWHYLSDIEGEPLMLNTIRRLRDRKIPVIVVAADEELIAALPEGVEVFTPPTTRRMCETMLATKHLWTGQMGVLQADVFYSERCMRLMCESEGLHWVGRSEGSALTGSGCGEVWGITWDMKSGVPSYINQCMSYEGDRLIRLFEESMEDAAERDPEHKKHLMATFWEPYRILAGFHPSEHNFETGGVWVECSDWTEDFDTEQDYTNWVARRKKRFFSMGLPPIPEQANG